MPIIYLLNEFYILLDLVRLQFASEFIHYAFIINNNFKCLERVQIPQKVFH